MKKILILILGILVANLSLNAIEYKDATEDQKKIFDHLVTLAEENKIEDFSNILNEDLECIITNIENPNLAGKILGEKDGDGWENKIEFLSTLYTHAVVSEIKEQVNSGNSEIRFRKIAKNIKKHKYVKTIEEATELLNESIKKNKKGQDTHFDYYFSDLIKCNKLLCPCFKSCLSWLTVTLKKHIESKKNEKYNNINNLLESVPYLVFCKISSKKEQYSVTEYINKIIKESPDKTISKENEPLINYIKTIQTEINEKKPGRLKQIFDGFRQIFN